MKEKFKNYVINYLNRLLVSQKNGFEYEVIL